MEIVSIEKKTFEEMKERFGCFSRHVKELCARYRPPGKMNWMDGADVEVFVESMSREIMEDE